MPFPPLAERFARREETWQIALQMWAGDERPFEGRYYRLERPLTVPRSVQQPHLAGRQAARGSLAPPGEQWNDSQAR